MSDHPDYLRPAALAELLDVSEVTLRRWRAMGYGPGWVKLSAHAVRYPRAAVDAWLRDRESHPARVTR